MPVRHPEFARVLNAAIAQSPYSVTQIAARFGRSYQHVYKYQRGWIAPNELNVDALADAVPMPRATARACLGFAVTSTEDSVLEQQMDRMRMLLERCNARERVMVESLVQHTTEAILNLREQG